MTRPRFSHVMTFMLGAVMTLTLGGVAYAANGGSLVIGRANSSTAATTLTNPNGTALALNSKPGTPGLAVNRNVRVPNLNADLVDGLNATAFLRTTVTVHGPSPVACPAGSHITGGGGSLPSDTYGNSQTNEYKFQSSMPSGNGWAATAVDKQGNFQVTGWQYTQIPYTPLVYAVCAKF